ncbi:MAG: hypothetical protein WC317_00115 [Candidatus Omnitrophota bacterium]|jgi:hypothetical protein
MRRSCLICFLVLALSSVGLSSFAEQGNLLVNPGFEKAGPSGWGLYGDATYDTGTYRSGKQSGKTWVWDYGDGSFEQYIKIIPGMQYKASVYILGKPGDSISGDSKAWIQIEWCTTDNVIISEPIKSPPLTVASDTWKLLSTPAVIAPSGAAKAKIKAVIQAAKKKTGGCCYFDDANFSSLPPM